jgi:hypothetical protein
MRGIAKSSRIGGSSRNQLRENLYAPIRPCDSPCTAFNFAFRWRFSLQAFIKFDTIDRLSKKNGGKSRTLRCFMRCIYDGEGNLVKSGSGEAFGRQRHVRRFQFRMPRLPPPIVVTPGTSPPPIDHTMNRISLRSLALAFCILTTTVSDAAAQNPNIKRFQQQQKQMQRRMEQAVKDAAASQPILPNDPELLSLHKEFIVKAEKLAGEYERKKQYDKAREVFEAMSRLVPKYPAAEAGVKRMLQLQSMKDRKTVKVQASSGWQDSGAQIVKGMPVHVDVKGTWSVVYETGPDGIVIPEKMKPRDSRIKLGSLIGVIASSPGELETEKPFIVKPGNDFVAEKSGRLYMRMFDIDPTDNQGEVLVLIQSTFGK